MLEKVFLEYGALRCGNVVKMEESSIFSRRVRRSCRTYCRPSQRMRCFLCQYPTTPAGRVDVLSR